MSRQAHDCQKQLIFINGRRREELGMIKVHGYGRPLAASLSLRVLTKNLFLFLHTAVETAVAAHWPGGDVVASTGITSRQIARERKAGNLIAWQDGLIEISRAGPRAAQVENGRTRPCLRSPGRGVVPGRILHWSQGSWRPGPVHWSRACATALVPICSFAAMGRVPAASWRCGARGRKRLNPLQEEI